jgi:pimeloyl-ACP methyl ester carboxylesterase
MAALAQATLVPPPFPDDAARCDGQPVIVIPGFLAPDMSTARLREFLERQNFKPCSWTCGFNIGPMPQVIREVERQVRDLAETTGSAVALVGVSLGGTTAREIAKASPGCIARVITLVSPIHLPVVTPLAPLAEAASLLWDMAALESLEAIAEAPPVPLTAIVSRDDGIIDWRASVPAPSDRVEVVEVSAPHMSICSNPDVQRTVADRLARP